jgi:hypothetical protein
MKASRLSVIAGVLLGAVVSGVSLLAAVLIWKYLDQHPYALLFVPVVGAVGVAIGIYLGLRVGRMESRVIAGSILVLTLAALGAAAGSWFRGDITSARFGLTVRGLLPIPMLDITIDANGRLGLRRKDHQITAQELRALAEGADVVVIATGWEGGAQVEAAALSIPRVEVHALKTGEAFAEYNRLRASGRKVALLAHTTC